MKVRGCWCLTPCQQQSPLKFRTCEGVENEGEGNRDEICMCGKKIKESGLLVVGTASCSGMGGGGGGGVMNDWRELRGK